MDKHTKLPWAVKDGRDKGFGIWIYAPEETVENDRGPSYPRQILEDEDYPEKLADAAFIVRCVNSHDALVAALEDMIELAYCAMKRANRDGAEYDRGEELKDARAALKLAKGE